MARICETCGKKVTPGYGRWIPSDPSKGVQSLHHKHKKDCERPKRVMPEACKTARLANLALTNGTIGGVDDAD